MSADDLVDFWVHVVLVETLTGTGGMGDVFAAPVELVCLVDDRRRLVRAADGTEVVSESTVFAPAGTTSLTPGSRVLLPSGRTSVVLALTVADSGGMDLPDHVQAACA